MLMEDNFMFFERFKTLSFVRNSRNVLTLDTPELWRDEYILADS